MESTDVTIGDLREWLVKNKQKDQWWTAADGTTFASPLSLSEIQSKADAKNWCSGLVSVMHTTEKNWQSLRLNSKEGSKVSDIDAGTGPLEAEEKKRDRSPKRSKVGYIIHLVKTVLLPTLLFVMLVVGGIAWLMAKQEHQVFSDAAPEALRNSRISNEFKRMNRTPVLVAFLTRDPATKKGQTPSNPYAAFNQFCIREYFRSLNSHPENTKFWFQLRFFDLGKLLIEDGSCPYETMWASCGEEGFVVAIDCTWGSDMEESLKFIEDKGIPVISLNAGRQKSFSESVVFLNSRSMNREAIVKFVEEILWPEYELTLSDVESAEDLPEAEQVKSQVVVASIDRSVLVRVYDSDGKITDLKEEDLLPGRELDGLKTLLESGEKLRPKRKKELLRAISRMSSTNDGLKEKNLPPLCVLLTEKNYDLDPDDSPINLDFKT